MIVIIINKYEGSLTVNGDLDLTMTTGAMQIESHTVMSREIISK